MKLPDLPAFGSTRSLVLRLLSDTSAEGVPPVGIEVQLRPQNEIYYLRLPVDGRMIRVEGDDMASRHALQDLLHHDVPLLAWIERRMQDKTDRTPLIVVGTRRFTNRQLLDKPLRIHVDRVVVEDLERKMKTPLDLPRVSGWLTEQFILPSSTAESADRFVLWPGQNDQSPFLLVGDRWTLRIARRPGGGWRADRLMKPKGDDGGARCLAEGKVEFGDFPEGADAGAVAELEALRRANAGYLALWQTYEKLEWESISKKAKELGLLNYKLVRRLANGTWEFTLAKVISAEQIPFAHYGEESLAVARNAPDYLTLATPPAPGKQRNSNQPDLRGDCISLQGTRLVLRPDPSSAERSPPKTGCIFLDLTGNSAALIRRSTARERIVSNLTGIPLFGWLEGHPLSSRQGRRHEPLSPAARAHFGPNGPTPRQIEAIDLALNTPDIALIQGPPGTGKTRVIAALLTRIAEIAEKEDRCFDKNLLTSFQHDAVENAAAISGVNGLPAIKFGRKRGVEQSTLVIDTWRHEHRKKLDEALAHLDHRPRRLVLENLRKHRLSYLQAPGSEIGAAMMLDIVSSAARNLLSIKLDQEIQATAARLRRGSAATDELDLLKVAVQGLRTSEAAFSDDGPRAAHRLSERLDEVGKLDDVTDKLLTRAARWQTDDSFEFISEIEGLRNRLLDELATPPPKTRITPVNSDVACLLERAVREVETRIAEMPDEGLDLVLERLREDLNGDPESLKETLGHYTLVLAATCQQAVSKTMLEQLEVGDDFATVVVDEAARANPLDLLIPLSRARRRIILVGDHRQLPHMLELDIERELERSLDEETRDAMKRSLFQRLFEQTKRQQEHDGIKRWVTLNAQYRMHPVLGDFVSRVFYERHGVEEKFTSPSPTENYVHPLTGAYSGKVAAWKHLPLREGLEQHYGKSWRRPVEARWIAVEAKRMLDNHPSLSLGVISFYAAQVACIREEMIPLGLTERDEQGETRINSAYEKTTNARGEPTERLRVGSVDAFQGKEFDIVILSFTRSNSMTAHSLEELRRKLGHLLLENRQCVAMSRQRQLLIIAGDSEMLVAPEVANAAPGLVEFLKLCESKEGVVLL